MTVQEMLDKNFIAKNEGRLFWVYTVCRTMTVTNRTELVRTFLKESEAHQHCDEMNLHPEFSKFCKWTVEKNKVII